MKNSKRLVDLVVISDTHLGTIGCRAEELYQYLKSIQPKTIVLNGDIIDIWQFSKRHWDKHHTKIIKELLKFVSNGVKVHYIAGNHDEALRRFLNFEIEGFKITNKLTLDLEGKKAWFFHGDVFDVTMQYSRWLTRLGGFGYDILILINSTVNKFLTLFGREKLSFSKTIKNKVKAAVSFINKFESTVVEIALKNNYDYVVCGHIHQPCIKTIDIKDGCLTYLNSGDWIENMTALEYHNKKWTLYNYESIFFEHNNLDDHDYKDVKTLFSDLVADINLKPTDV
ncbi:MAG: UDP-2,3-diacylglucosamine diphosphatase [Bacteroidetes bacterium]|nr:UDP-2,3-diacylglucosamine diphosphatase [Bacteroidota bacterium]